MKKVYIRADAGQAIGYGHFVRCLALAAMLRDEFECTIFTQTPNEFQEREASGICPLVSLPADDSKFDLFLNYLQGDEIVVLDNYFFTEDYIRTIQSIRPAEPNESLQAPQSVCAHRAGDGNPENAVCAHRTGGGCKVVRIQDFFNERSCADALIFPCRTPRQALLRPPFLTPQDAPDTHCSPICPHQKGDGNPGNPVPLTETVMANHSAETEICYKQDTAGKSSKWVVTFGGSDPLGLTDRFASELRERGFEVVTLRGGLSASEVAELFRSAEGVICSASSVCYEALACGCKVFAGWYVDNQLDFYNLLASRGLIVPLGDLRNGNLPTEFGSPVQSASSQAHDFAAAASAAVAPSAVSSAAVSPAAVASAAVAPAAVASAATVTPPASGIAAQFRQAPRYYRTLFHSLSLEMVNYTDLSPEQSHAVWELRNREEIRRWMTNPEPFSFESHCRFIESLKTRSDREYYAFFQDGLLVGSYDLTDINLPTGTAAPAGSPESTPTGAASSPAATTGTADSGLFVNPEAQGHGIAKQMAARMDSRALWLGISTLHAVVLEDNERSLRFHKSIGYEPTVPNADSSSSGSSTATTSSSTATTSSNASTTPGSSDNNTTATGPTLIHLTKLL